MNIPYKHKLLLFSVAFALVFSIFAGFIFNYFNDKLVLNKVYIHYSARALNKAKLFDKALTNNDFSIVNGEDFANCTLFKTSKKNVEVFNFDAKKDYNDIVEVFVNSFKIDVLFNSPNLEVIYNNKKYQHNFEIFTSSGRFEIGFTKLNSFPAISINSEPILFYDFRKNIFLTSNRQNITNQSKFFSFSNNLNINIKTTKNKFSNNISLKTISFVQKALHNKNITIALAKQNNVHSYLYATLPENNNFVMQYAIYSSEINSFLSLITYNTIWVSILIFASALICLLIFTIFFSNKISSSFNTLKQSFDKISTSFNKLNIDSNTELDQQLSKMSNLLNDYYQQNQDKEIDHLIKLQKSEKKFERIVTNLPDIFWQTNENFIFTYLSPSTKNILGYSLETHPNLSIQQICPSINVAEIIALTKTRKFQTKLKSSNELINQKLPLKHADGHFIMCKITAVSIFDGIKLAGFTGLTRDITEEYETEQKLKHQTSSLANLLNNSANVKYCYNIKTKSYSYLTNNVHEIGYNLSQVQRKPHSFLLKNIVYEDKVFLRSKIRSLTKNVYSKTVSFSIDLRRLLNTNQIVWFSNYITLFFDEASKLSLVSFEINNINKQKSYLSSLESLKKQNTTVLANTPAFVFCYNVKQNKYEYFSDHATKMLGYTKLELSNFTFEDILGQIHPEDFTKTEDYFNKQIVESNGKTAYININYRTKCANGKYIWVNKVANVYLDETKKPETILGTINDINNIFTSQQALQNKYNQLEFLFNNIPVALCMVNADDTIGYLNSSYQNMFGYTQNEMQSVENWFKSVEPNPDKQIDLKKEWFKIKQTPKKIIYPNNTFVFRCKNQKYISVKFMVTKVNDKFIVIAEDVTQQQKMLQSAKENEKRLHMVLDITSDGVWDYNILADKIYYSKNYCAMLGYPQVPVTSSISDFFKSIHPDDITKVKKALSNNISNKTNLYRIEFRIKTKNNNYKWVLSRGQVAKKTANNSALRMLGTHTDITDIKTFELKLMEATQKAEAANHAKSLFLANMNHELRTPLNAILGYVQLLKHEDEPELRRKGFDTIERSGRHLLKLISEILDFSKLEAKKMKLNLQIFNLREFINIISEMVKVKTFGRATRFYLVEESNLPVSIKADDIRLKQVLLNLLTNALKFTDEGRVTLKIKYTKPYLHFSVEDEGTGIKPDQLKTIFSPFKQADENKKYIEGTGLGLSISRSLIQLMGGDLHVESNFGKGSKFWFEVKVEEYNIGIEEKNESKKIIGFSPSPKNVLIVDKHNENREYLSSFLSSIGFSTKSKKELTMQNLDNSDLLLIDPAGKVLDFVPKIKELKNIYKNLKIIIVSTQDTFKHKLDLLDAGASAIITKPIIFEELYAVIEASLHIKWIYEADKNYLTSIENQEEQVPEDIKLQIKEFAEEGDIIGLKKAIEKIKSTQPSYLRQIDYILEMADNFEIEKIITYLS